MSSQPNPSDPHAAHDRHTVVTHVNPPNAYTTKNTRFQRVIIYAKDIQALTGKSERYGRLMIRKVKDHFHKADHHFVTIHEFCQYTGLTPDDIEAFLG